MAEPEIAEPDSGDNAADETEAVGEPVCWLNRVCDVCGALVDTSLESCWRCGTPVAVD